MGKTVLLATLMSFVSNVLWGQVVQVMDLDHQPIENAIVSDLSSKKRVTTNAKGRADLTKLKGADSLLVEIQGYTPRFITRKELEENNFIIILSANPITLTELVFTESKREESVEEIPAHVATVRREEIKLHNPQTGADLVELTGEVYVQKSQMGGGSPMIRGFAANRILLAIDGVRMNNAIFRSGNLQNSILLDANNVESVQVLFGPGSVIYGSDAVGGVVHYRTLTPKFSTNDSSYISTGSALFRHSTANKELTGHFDLRTGNTKWATVTSVSFSDYGDQKMGSNGPEEYLDDFYVQRIGGTDSALVNERPRYQRYTNYNQFNALQKVAYKPVETVELTYGFHYSLSSDIPRYDRLIQTKNGNPKYAEWKYGGQYFMMNSLNILATKPNRIWNELSITLAKQDYEESRHDRKFGQTNRRSRTEDVDAYSINLDADKLLNEKSKIYYGAEAVRNNVGSEAVVHDIETDSTYNTNTRYPDGSSWSSYAGYVMYKHHPNEAFTLETGVRYNYVSVEATLDTAQFPLPFGELNFNKGAMSGSIGFTWSPDSTWLFNGNLSSGFRAPNIDDMAKVFDSEPGAVVVPNDHLSPEYAYNADLGITKLVGEDLKVKAALFYTYLDNALVRRNASFNGEDSILYDGQLSRVQSIQNAAFGRVYGFHVSCMFRFAKRFTFEANYNYQEGIEELDDGTTAPMRHAAPMFGSMSVTYQQEKLTLTAYADAMGEVTYQNLAISEQGKPHLYAVDSNGNPYSPAWYTLNVKASYQIANWLNINVGLENITDQRYRPYSSGLAAPGRNFIIAMRAGF